MRILKMYAFLFIFACMIGFPDIIFCGGSAYTIKEIENILDEQIKKNVNDGKIIQGIEKNKETGTPESSFKEIQASYWINSEPLKIADQKGKVVVIEFWATWCPYCRKSIPYLNKLYAKYKNKNIVFMALTDESHETVESYAKEMKMPYPIAGGSKSGNDYDVASVPHALIIGPYQQVVWKGHPMDPEFEKTIMSLLD